MEKIVHKTSMTSFNDYFKITKTYANGSAWDAIAKKEMAIKTPYGNFTPRFHREESRQKFSKSVSFYKTGELKSIVPQDQTEIMTPVGKYPAELITFHKNGMLHRVFPLNGQIDGFWTETDEATLAESYTFDLAIGKFEAKIIAIQFYETGALKGVTLWPGEVVEIATPLGVMPCRIGFTLYPDGALESFEPGKPVVLQSKIGNISAYDYDALGIHADSNAVSFTENGDLRSALTPLTTINVTSGNGFRRIAPKTMINPLDGESLILIATKIVFNENAVIINDEVFDDPEALIRAQTMTVLTGAIGGTCQL
jgi:hypothetical protein